jgi:tRNA pseudouridine55 synthase
VEQHNSPSGILLVNKAAGTSSFYLVSLLRKLTKIRKIGHAGTLDPFATGVMVMLIGKQYTKKSNQFLCSDKEYQATLQLGAATDTYDIEGKITAQSDFVPTLEQVEQAIAAFQGEIEQIPPMYSAKKVKGKKLYELARSGVTIERSPVKVQVSIKLISYNYPLLKLDVTCSKGTYIRSLAHDLGEKLTSKAHLQQLMRTRSGSFTLQECVEQDALKDLTFPYLSHLKTE